MLRYLTAGESHGIALVGILDGFVKGLDIDVQELNNELALRQNAYGRGDRRHIESDKVEFLAGVRGKISTGNPIAFLIKNADYWKEELDCINGDTNAKPINIPRPGHADYAGMTKFDTTNARDISERASARDTATRTVIGAICNQLLKKAGISVYGVVSQIGHAKYKFDPKKIAKDSTTKTHIVGCFDSVTADLMTQQIDTARDNGDSIGGKVTLIASGVPAGVGHYAQHDTKLDCNIAGQLSGLQSVKSVEFGLGVDCATVFGSQMQDAICYDKHNQIVRHTNNAGGIEGGMTNGQDIMVTLVLKPIPTILQGVDSVDLSCNQKAKTVYQRSDVCHVPATSIIAKNIFAFSLTQALLTQTGAVTLKEFLQRLKKQS